jgi:hypothetical protein
MSVEILRLCDFGNLAIVYGEFEVVVVGGGGADAKEDKSAAANHIACFGALSLSLSLSLNAQNAKYISRNAFG